MISQTLVFTLTSTLLITLLIQYFHNEINIYFMGFFRDLARLKAKQRRFETNGNTAVSLVSSTDDLKMLILKIEDDPLSDLNILDSNKEQQRQRDMDDLPTYTRKELYEFGDGKEENPILLSLFGRVYNVTSGQKFYGPKGKYHSFAGRDVTYALSTGCLAASCLGSIDGKSANKTNDDNDDGIDNCNFTDNELKEGKKWVAFFETHDSYSLVGLLNEQSQVIDQLMDRMVEMETAAE